MQGLGGLVPGLNRGASMSGNKTLNSLPGVVVGFSELIGASGADVSGTLTAPTACIAHCFVFGAGGYNTVGTTGGSGGEARYGRIKLRVGQSVSMLAARYLTSNGDGYSSTVSGPDDELIVAGGGFAVGTTGAGYTLGSGGEIVRRPGLGTTTNPGGTSPDLGGGTGGIGSGGGRSNGAGGGFGDMFAFVRGGNARSYSPNTVEQPGGGADNNGIFAPQRGSPGRVVVFLVA